jgi:hypothetical protein
MKKSLFVLALLGFSAVFATGQVPFNSPTASASIAVKATIQQSLSVLLSSNAINFDVQDAAKPTNGDTAVTIQGNASMAKNHGFYLTIYSTDLTGVNDGQVIPASLLLAKTTGAQGFSPLSNGAWNYDPLSISASKGILNQTAGLSTSLSLQLSPVPNYVPDVYAGTVTILAQVM